MNSGTPPLGGAAAVGSVSRLSLGGAENGRVAAILDLLPTPSERVKSTVSGHRRGSEFGHVGRVGRARPNRAECLPTTVRRAPR